MNVFDLSESRIGLVTELGIPAHSVLPIALAVPGLETTHRAEPQMQSFVGVMIRA